MTAAFRPGAALTMQAAAALLVVLALAVWQLSRGIDKTALADIHRQRLSASAQPAAAFSAATPDFTRLTLAGEYDPTQHFFVNDGGGFQVLSLLRTDTGVFLVNRGWIAAPYSPSTLPAVPAGTVELLGVVWPLPKLTPRLAGEPWSPDWPKRARAVNPERMAAATGAHGREIRLAAGGAGVLRAAPVTWDYSPGTHWGYAAQWLLLGVGVVAGYVVVGRRRARAAQNDG